MTDDQIEKIVQCVRAEVDARMAAKSTPSTPTAATPSMLSPQLQALGTQLIESVKGYVARSMKVHADRIDSLEKEIAELKAKGQA